MKHFFFASLAFLIVHSMPAQSGLCDNGYLPFQKGVSFELTSYNHKDKVSGTVKHEITSIEQADGGFNAVVATQMFDDKKKPTVTGAYTIECREDGLAIDMTSLLNPETMSAFSTMEINVTGDALKMPNTLTPGQALPDGTMNMKASMGGLSLLNLTVTVSDRNVVATESITTPAGTFDCVKMTQTTTLDGFGNKSYTSTTWYAKGIGMVRTENYDKKGELESYTELTSFKKS